MLALLHGDIAHADSALAAIDVALNCCPNDKGIQEERTAIVRWIASGENYDADQTPLPVSS
jgi:hypothetical protein